MTPEMDIEFIVEQRLLFAENGHTFPELMEKLDNAGFRDTENKLTNAIESLFNKKKIAFANFMRDNHKPYLLAHQRGDN